MLKNITKNEIIVKKVKYCKGFLRYIGLMFSKIKDEALIFEFKSEQIIIIHMFFVFSPIDLIFLDKNKKVVELKENLKPFCFYKSKKKARYVVELPYEVINKSKTEIGDVIKF